MRNYMVGTFVGPWPWSVEPCRPLTCKVTMIRLCRPSSCVSDYVLGKALPASRRGAGSSGRPKVTSGTRKLLVGPWAELDLVLLVTCDLPDAAGTPSSIAGNHKYSRTCSAAPPGILLPLLEDSLRMAKLEPPFVSAGSNQHWFHISQCGSIFCIRYSIALGLVDGFRWSP